MEFFRRVVDWPSLKATGAKLSFQGFVTGELWIALVTFLYIDFLDTTGTLFSMASFINNYIPGAPAAPAGAESVAPCCDGIIPCGRLIMLAPRGWGPWGRSGRCGRAYTSELLRRPRGRPARTRARARWRQACRRRHRSTGSAEPAAPACSDPRAGARAGFVGANKEFPRQTFAFSVDGIASIIGSLMGTSPVRPRRPPRPARPRACFLPGAACARRATRAGRARRCRHARRG
jgi:hypothetical protein